MNIKEGIEKTFTVRAITSEVPEIDKISLLYTSDAADDLTR